MWDVLFMKSTTKPKSEFGERLKKLRLARGLTQSELGRMIGASQRVVEYYENQSKFPPITFIPAIAKALKVSADELLGIKNVRDEDVTTYKKLLKRFKAVQGFSVRDQKVVFAVINNIKAKLNSKQSPSKNGTL